MSDALKEDYSRFKKEIEKSSRNIFTITNTLEPIFKKHHKSTYAIALILSKLKQVTREENQLIFLAEILSDLLTISKLAFLGFETPSQIILRRVVENFYNHIYYFNHAIEYAHLNAGRNEYTPMEKLKIYFESHPFFFDSEDKTLRDYNQELFKEYQTLCKVVHSKGRDSMNLANNLKDLKSHFDIEDLLKTLTSIELYIVYLTYKFHKDLRFTPTENNIILTLVPSSKRAFINR